MTQSVKYVNQSAITSRGENERENGNNVSVLHLCQTFGYKILKRFGSSILGLPLVCLTTAI